MENHVIIGNAAATTPDSFSGLVDGLHETNVTELAMYRRVEPNRQTNELSTCVCEQLSSFLSELCVDFLNRQIEASKSLQKRSSAHTHTQGAVGTVEYTGRGDRSYNI